jgi:DNA-binding GntR family transcriptional regulator
MLRNANPYAGMQVARRSAAELICDGILEKILTGDLRPGEPLREQDIAEGFGVARNTVREALRLLTREGLAVHQVHRGVSVRTFEPDEVREVFAVRQLVESAVAERAGSLSPEEIVYLQEAIDASETASRAGDIRANVTYNLEFHRRMVELVGNRRLDAVFNTLLSELRLILSALENQDRERWVALNRELLTLLVDGKGREFRKQLRNYIQLAEAETLEVLGTGDRTATD